MKKDITKILITTGLLFSLASNVLAQTGVSELDQMIGRIKSLLQALAFIISVIFVMIGGYYMITAGGSAESFQKGRSFLIYALIGLAVVLLAEALARFAKYIATGTQ